MDASDLGLGKLIQGERLRDAVHIAVAPVEAGESLKAGDHVSVMNGRAAVNGTPIGVVDPFLVGTVEPGQRFWLFLYPGSITSLRHEWTHPEIPADNDVRITAEAWLRAFAMEHRVDYDDMIEGASTGEGVRFGNDHYGDITGEFWAHLGVVTGKTFSDSHRENTAFSCSC